LQAEKELEDLKKQMENYKEEMVQWKKSTAAKFEEALNKQKSQHLEYILQVEQWRKDKEFEVDSQMATKDSKITQNEQTIANAMEEIKQWKEIQSSSFQEIIKVKDKLIEKQNDDLKKLREQLTLLRPTASKKSPADDPGTFFL
jgi:hypothetical protein